MDFLKDITNDSFLLIPNNIKDKVLDYLTNNKLLINIKLISFNDLKNGLLYGYTNEAIYYVMKNYKVNYAVAKDFINNTYYLEDEQYKSDKLNTILSIKDDLNTNNLLVIDPLFKDLLKSKKQLYVYGFDYINKFNNYLLELASQYIEVKNIDKEMNNNVHKVIEFNSMEDEVFFVAEEISKLITEGVPLNKIYIANYSNEYLFTMHRIFKQFNIPYYVKSETNLYYTHIGRYFIENLDNDIDKLLFKISKKFDIENNSYNMSIYNAIFNLINTYYWADNYLDIKDLIMEEMMRKTIPTNHFDQEVTTTSIINNIFLKDEYVFLIGFNLNSCPTIKKDEDYINDSIKTRLMETTIETNKNNKEVLLKAIGNIDSNNLYITYKLHSSTNTYFASSLIDGKKLIKEVNDISYSTYSDDYNKYLYASKIDNLIKFNEKDEALSILNSNYDIPYVTYDNRLTPLDKNKIKEILEDGKHTFNYSNISKYYKCPFKFYLDYFYRLDTFEQTIDTFVGSLFHGVLEVCINDPSKDIDKEYDKYLEEHKDDMTFTKGDKFFIEHLRKDIHFIVDGIRKQYTYSTHDIKNELHEEEVKKDTKDLDLNVSVNTIVKGIVDKLLIINKDYMIIDYKTGNSDKIDSKLFKYGIDIQLPIYLYLLKNLDKDNVIVGMYLQHILPGFIAYKDILKKDIDEYRLSSLRLDGLTLDDESKIKQFDSTCDDSLVIKSLKKKVDGNWRYPATVITYDEEKELYDTVKKLIEDCINNTADGNFEIKPINIYQKVDGCDYCKYRDVCYRRNSDINYQSIYEAQGGDDNE